MVLVVVPDLVANVLAVIFLLTLSNVLLISDPFITEPVTDLT